MGEVILSMTNIHKAFGPVRALRSAALELRRGEIHALAGENGAGKSTLMHIIDGILQPDGGEILLDGKAVRISSPMRRTGSVSASSIRRSRSARRFRSPKTCSCRRRAKAAPGS